jgi:hypothetical protein
MQEQKIIEFISRLRRRLNRLAMLWLLPFAVLEMNIIAAVAALFWLIHGLHAPWQLTLYAVASIFFLTLIIWLFRRSSQHDAAIFGDRFFSLKDALVSELEFTDDDAFHQLRRKQTVEHCSARRIGDVKLKQPGTLWLLALLLTGCNLWLYSLDDAPYIKQRRRQAKLTEQRSKAANKQLEKELKQLEKTLTKPQKKLLEKAGVKKALEELKAQKELKKSLLQYAELEKCLQKLQDQMKPDPNLEKLLKQLARELKRAPEMQKLGKMLARGQNAESAAELRKMKLGKASKKSLQEKLKKLQALSQAAKRMPDNNSALSEKLKEMSKSLSELEKELADSKNSDISDCKFGEQIDGELDKLAQMMQQQAAMSEFAKKLAAMRQAAAAAQSSMLGLQQGKGPGMKSIGEGGGKQGEGAGTAAMGNMDRKDKSPDSGRFTKITGRKNSGPGASKTIDAKSGRGEMRRGVNGSDRAFKYQLEEFFVRDDVPADMKKGVKKYFSELHK